MTKKSILMFLLCVGMATAQPKPPHKRPSTPETPHLDFVKEYVRELINDEDLKVSADKEFGDAKTPIEQFSSGIYFSKSSQLELRSQIAMLKSMRLKAPFENLIPNLTAIYQRQIELHQKLIIISSKFLAGPKEGVDYQSLVAKFPEIRAELDNLRKIMLEATPLIFMALIDQKQDSLGHASHLVITKAEKADLQNELNTWSSEWIGGACFHPDNFVQRHLKPILTKLGLKGAMHAFRHGNFTALDRLNAPMKVRQRD